MSSKKKSKYTMREIKELYAQKVYGNKKPNDNWRGALLGDYQESKRKHKSIRSKKKQIRLKSKAFNTQDTFFRAYENMTANDKRTKSANKFDLRIKKIATNEEQRRRIERAVTRRQKSKVDRMISRVALKPFNSRMNKLVKQHYNLRRRKAPDEALIKRFFDPRKFDKKNQTKWREELKGKYLETLEIKPLVQSLNNSFFETAIEKIDTSHIPRGGLVNTKRLYINRMFKKEFRSQSEKKKKFLKKFIFPNASRSSKLKKLMAEVDDGEPGGCMQMTDLWSENTLSSAHEKMKFEKIKIELIRLANQDDNRVKSKSKEMYKGILRNAKKRKRMMERKHQEFMTNIQMPQIKLNQLVSEASSLES